MPEYQNIPLLQGENVVFGADFTPFPLRRSIKSGLVVTRERVVLRHPQYMFFIKVGYVVESSLIRTIAEVSAGSQLSPRRVKVALITAGIGVAMLPLAGFFGLGILLALVLFGVAALQLWLARSLGLTLRNFGAGTLSVGVDTTEHQAMLAAAHTIQQLMLNTNTTAQELPSPSAGPEPTAGLAVHSTPNSRPPMLHKSLDPTPVPVTASRPTGPAWAPSASPHPRGNSSAGYNAAGVIPTQQPPPPPRRHHG